MVLYCLGVPSLGSVLVCPSEFIVLLGCACHLMCTHIPTNSALTLRNCETDRCTSHCTFQNKSGYGRVVFKKQPARPSVLRGVPGFVHCIV